MAETGKRMQRMKESSQLGLGRSDMKALFKGIRAKESYQTASEG
jgi:hypothetical protein